MGLDLCFSVASGWKSEKNKNDSANKRPLKVFLLLLSNELMKEITDSNAIPKYDKTLKILVLGDMDVGKTSIMRRFIDNSFPNQHISTIGIEFGLKEMIIDDKRVQIQMWDRAEEEPFETVQEHFTDFLTQQF